LLDLQHRLGEMVHADADVHLFRADVDTIADAARHIERLQQRLDRCEGRDELAPVLAADRARARADHRAAELQAEAERLRAALETIAALHRGDYTAPNIARRALGRAP
jgi:hypothetical protein